MKGTGHHFFLHLRAAVQSQANDPHPCRSKQRHQPAAQVHRLLHRLGHIVPAAVLAFQLRIRQHHRWVNPHGGRAQGDQLPSRFQGGIVRIAGQAGHHLHAQFQPRSVHAPGGGNTVRCRVAPAAPGQHPVIHTLTPQFHSSYAVGF